MLCVLCSVQYLLCRPAPVVLPQLLSKALFSVIDGCGLLAVDLLGQAVGPSVNMVMAACGIRLTAIPGLTSVMSLSPLSLVFLTRQHLRFLLDVR